MAVDEATLLIRLPVELKGSFQGLCKARGVSVSEELRRFMADEVASAALGMTTRDRPRDKTVAKKNPVVKASKKQTEGSETDKPTRCDKTGDLFDGQTPVDSQKDAIAAFNANKADRAKDTAKRATQGKFKLSDDLMNGISARDKRKKPKKK